jgi:hypothetical protein
VVESIPASDWVNGGRSAAASLMPKQKCALRSPSVLLVRSGPVNVIRQDARIHAATRSHLAARPGPPRTALTAAVVRRVGYSTAQPPRSAAGAGESRCACPGRGLPRGPRRAGARGRQSTRGPRECGSPEPAPLCAGNWRKDREHSSRCSDGREPVLPPARVPLRMKGGVCAEAPTAPARTSSERLRWRSPATALE